MRLLISLSSYIFFFYSSSLSLSVHLPHLLYVSTVPSLPVPSLSYFTLSINLSTVSIYLPISLTCSPLVFFSLSLSRCPSLSLVCLHHFFSLPFSVFLFYFSLFSLSLCLFLSIYLPNSLSCMPPSFPPSHSSSFCFCSLFFSLSLSIPVS